MGEEQKGEEQKQIEIEIERQRLASEAKFLKKAPPRLPPPEAVHTYSELEKAVRRALEQDLAVEINVGAIEDIMTQMEEWMPATKQLLDRMLAGEGV